MRSSDSLRWHSRCTTTSPISPTRRKKKRSISITAFHKLTRVATTLRRRMMAWATSSTRHSTSTMTRRSVHLEMTLASIPYRLSFAISYAVFRTRFRLFWQDSKDCRCHGGGTDYLCTQSYRETSSSDTGGKAS